MPGHLIIVAGLSGAGKTTLITETMQRLPNLRYLTTYTTRPPRESEHDSFEHIFVDEPTYQKQQHASSEWDHAEYYGAWYGTDVAATRQLLATHDVICAIAPDPAIVRMLKYHYPSQYTVIWIDIPSPIAKQRISHDKLRSERQEETMLAASANYTFQPTGELATDSLAFTQLISEISTQ
jgi:guanylate kinase